MTRINFDHERVSFNVARIKKAGQIFEIVIDPDLAMAYKQGGEIDIREILHAEKIFSDPRKGNVVSAEILKKNFSTDDILEVAKKILKEGEIQLTTEYREKKRDEKRRKILEIIHRNTIDSRTGLPHPIIRLENAFEEAKVHIDDTKSAEDQLTAIIDKLRPIIPLKFETKEIELHVPGNLAAKMYGYISGFGKLKKNEWQNDGSWYGIIEIPAGLQTEFFDELNSRTHGSIQIKVIK
ncbi:MAG: ribosome assembly factor SBDS [Nanoarchaeota archaeon]